MRNAIWKFPLTITDAQIVKMPAGARVISAQMQYGALCLWAVVEPSAEKEPRMFRIIWTGHPFNVDGLQYISTVQDAGLVWHVFEVEV